MVPAVWKLIGTPGFVAVSKFDQSITALGVVMLIVVVPVPVVIEPATYASAALIVLAAGVVSALLVRRQIDRLDLVSVLKVRE